MEKNIGFNDKYNFGVEIEFANDNRTLSEIYRNSINNLLPIRYLINHKKYDITFDRWILDEDPTVTKIVSDNYYGGEISSRILSDNVDSWKELKKICELLKNNKSYIDMYCGEHINIDISRYLDNPKFFEVLYKFLIVYEPEIDIFFRGDKNYIRNTTYGFANNMRDRLFANIKKVDFNSKYYIDNIRYKSRSFKISDGISLYKLYKSNLMEIRYPNGTLNPDVIQNNINFSLSILSAIENDKIDLDFLNYLIKEGKEDDFMFRYNFFCYFNDCSKLDSLLNQICQNEKSRVNFTKQYQKILTKEYNMSNKEL